MNYELATKDVRVEELARVLDGGESWVHLRAYVRLSRRIRDGRG